MQVDLLCVDGHKKTAAKIAACLNDFPLNVRDMPADTVVRVLEAADEKEAKQFLSGRDNHIKAVLVSINEEDAEDGENQFSIISRIKGKPEYMDLSFIVLSGRTDIDWIVKAIESGASAYAAWPPDGCDLSRKLSEIIAGTMRSRPQISHEHNHLTQDVITFTFWEMLNREVKAAGRGNYTMAISLLTFTDNATADAEEFIDVLNSVVKAQLRDFDSCFRYGNRGIIVLLPFADGDGADIVCNKILHIFKTNSVLRNRNNGLSLTAASVSYPKDGKVPNKLIDKLVRISSL
ncbi:MAG: GGDEF domain-containing protein [Clostridiales bacterium]|nr:GGDEF domain-containing protein [Clostridiales bacterium]